MYNSSSHGPQSYSTPTSPNSYSAAPQHNTEGSVAYDKELASLFRATAANVTQLYKEASEIGSNAFKAGYEQCYSDICEYIASKSQDGGGGEPNIEVQQLLAHRLREFAQGKHISQRHIASETSTPSPGFARMAHPESRPPSAAEYTQSSRQQNQHATAGNSFESEAHPERHLVPSLPTAERYTKASDPANQPQSSILLAVNTMQHGGNSRRNTLEDDDFDGNVKAGYDEDGNNTENVQTGSSANNARDDQRCDLPRGPMPPGSGEHGMSRGKRTLESFDLMDIEPPRRRLRRDDIEMS